MTNGITGVKYKRGCHPDDLWTTYHTSSRYVKKFRKEHGEPDVIEVRRTFDCVEQAQDWESKVIERMDAVKSKRWLNKKNPKGKFYNTGYSTNESRMKTSKSMAARRENNPELWSNQKKVISELWKTDDYKIKQQVSRQAYWSIPENRELRSDIQKETQNRNEVKAKISESNKKSWADPNSDQRKEELSHRMLGDNNPSKRVAVREKQRQKALNREKRTCPHCGKTCSINVYVRWHGEMCPTNV